MSEDRIQVTIRSTIKKIDEISLSCPLTWTIYQLKVFVAMNHTQGSEYLKPNKTQIFFGGKILNNEDTLEITFKNVSF